MRSNDQVIAAIQDGQYNVIPFDKRSRNFVDENPWPPKQFKCQECGKEFDSIETHCRTCYSNSARCTHCGDYMPMWDGALNFVHDCNPYGKHCRTIDAPKETYYMRVWSYGKEGRHHFSYDARLQYVWVQSLTGPSQFRYFGRARGLERAKMLIAGLPNNFGRF